MGWWVRCVGGTARARLPASLCVCTLVEREASALQMVDLKQVNGHRELEAWGRRWRVWGGRALDARQHCAATQVRASDNLTSLRAWRGLEREQRSAESNEHQTGVGRRALHAWAEQ